MSMKFLGMLWGRGACLDLVNVKENSHTVLVEKAKHTKSLESSNPTREK